MESNPAFHGKVHNAAQMVWKGVINAPWMHIFR